MMKKLRRVAAAVLVIAAVLGIVIVRFVAPVTAVPHRVERGDLDVEVFGRGTLESQREAQLGFDLVGRLSDVLVEEGQRVTLGQELARLYTDQVQADFKVASSGVAAARASLSRLSSDERRARAALEAAEREEQRARTLVTSGVIPQRDVDLAVDGRRIARAELDRILAQRSEATRSIEVAAGGAEQRRVTVLRATLLAPFDGLVTRRLREPGDTVSVGTTVLRLVDTEHTYVSAWLDETVVARVQEAQAARLLLPGDPAVYEAAVARVGWESDRQTHELLVDIVPAKLGRRIAIGQRADVWIVTERRKGVLTLPIGHVLRDANGPYCQVDRGGRVTAARLTLGVSGRDRVEIVEGLAEGDVALRSDRPDGVSPLGRKWRAP